MKKKEIVFFDYLFKTKNARDFMMVKLNFSLDLFEGSRDQTPLQPERCSQSYSWQPLHLNHHDDHDHDHDHHDHHRHHAKLNLKFILANITVNNIDQFSNLEIRNTLCFIIVGK